MKTFPLAKFHFWIGLVLISFVLYSCKKKTELARIVSDEEYIHYTVNGTAYHYDMPTDNVTDADSSENQSFIATNLVRGDRIPDVANDHTFIYYYRDGISQGSVQTLKRFSTPQTGVYIGNFPGTATSPTLIPVYITDYGNIGEYISGNFSATLTGPPPGNVTFIINCEFRVKR